MCGIAGWFDRRLPQPEDQPRLEKMTKELAHRGPDGQGTCIVDHAALGHTRLAIIDPTGGKQPFTDLQNRAVITFNGEIYNYRELRAELVSKGVKFTTQSDTEVVLQMYLQQGLASFGRLRGMFAFALWDRRSQQGFLVRDPLGIKPLFYQQHEAQLTFGSEAKAILAGGATASLDTGALHLLMNFRYILGEQSLFEGIQQLAPGEVLSWSQRGTHRQLIDNQNLTATSDLSPMDALRDSVQAHLVADVPIAAYLSGGVDSACIVAMANRPLPTYTVDVGDDPVEAKNAARSADLLGVSNQCLAVAFNAEQDLPKLIRHLETPKINALQVGLLAEATSTHGKVTLSGLGGDELFYGYNAHGIIHRVHSLTKMLPNVLGRSAGSAAAFLLSTGKIPWTEPERAARMLAAQGNWPRIYGLLRNVWDQPQMRQLLYGPRMLDSSLPDAFETLESRWPKSNNPVEAITLFERQNKLVNDLLWNEDRMSMAHGLEVRVPFVDQPLIATISHLSRKELMPAGRPKGWFRDALSEVLPTEIIQRRKSGFQVDSPTFFHQHLATLADQYLSERRVREIGLFNPETISTWRRLPPTKRWRWHYFILYLMLMTHLWVEEFEETA